VHTLRVIAVLLWVAGAVPLAPQTLGGSDILELPFGESKRLSSPDGRYVLFGREYDQKANKPPELWIEDTRTSRRTRLLELNGTASAAWSPDGTAFYVNNRWASDSENACIYDAATLQRIDLGKAIVDNDREARRFANGHAYFEVDRWQGSQNVAVRFHGHSDEAPVVCFELRYDVSRTSSVKKLSQRTAPVTSTGCQ
jgi:dipeptidyl aminopeptidase/acylaminoacyl peptidase